MKVYISWNMISRCWRELKGKREANVACHDPDLRIFEVEGRKGKELGWRTKKLVERLLANEEPQCDHVKLYFQKTITRKRSPSHNDKISNAMSGRSLTEEHKSNISNSMLGNRNRV